MNAEMLHIYDVNSRKGTIKKEKTENKKTTLFSVVLWHLQGESNP